MANYLGVAPWDLENAPEHWLSQGYIAMMAEHEAAVEIRNQPRTPQGS